MTDRKITYALLGIIALLPSCVTYKACLDRFGKTQGDTTIVKVPYAVIVPADSAEIRYLPGETIHDTIIKSGRARLIIRHDSVDRIIQALCDPITRIDTVLVKQPPLVKFADTRQFWQFIPFWLVVLIAGLLGYLWLKK